MPNVTVIGIDNMNAYYDVALKEFRLNELAKYPTFTFVKGNIADKELITELFEKYKPSVVVNLAAQAGLVPGVWHVMPILFILRLQFSTRGLSLGM